MSYAPGDYYSVTNGAYTKHPNIQIIGIDALPRPSRNNRDSPSLSRDNQLQSKYIIQEEDVEYDLQQSRHAPQNISTSIIQNRHPYGQTIHHQKMAYSCIGNNSQERSVLKRSLHELNTKNISSHEDQNCDKILYIQLEKERRYRRDLERSYKKLLSQIQRNEHYYSVDFNQQEQTQHKRRFSKRTLKNESSELICSYQDLIHPHQNSDVKTVKHIQNIQLKNEQKQQDEQEDSHSQQSINYRKQYKHMKTQQSVQSQDDYFKQQRDFQVRVLENLKGLNKRVAQMDEYLAEKEEEREKDKVKQAIVQKQKEVGRLQQQNELLRKFNTESLIPVNNNQIDLLKNIAPSSLYLMTILLMAIIAMV